MDPYLGEIRMFGGTFAPVDWALCNGQTLPISGNDALYSLIGTTYGGDGQSTFGLPDLQGRVPAHVGGTFAFGQAGGQEQVTLTVAQLPQHNHTIQFTTAAGTKSDPTGQVPGTLTGQNVYVERSASTALAANSITTDGGQGQPHENRQPYVCVTFIIATAGVWPSQ